MILDDLRKECESCRKCEIGGQLIDNHLSNVFSNMNVNAKVMVVGQNPGYDEVIQGTPFVGISGQFFMEKLQEVVGFTRDDIYISNIVRCFTPKNRKPISREISSCQDFLDKEIRILKPLLIIGLGTFALKRLTGMPSITQHHGIPILSLRYKVIVVSTFHPSPYNMNKQDLKDEFLHDLATIKDVWEKISRKGTDGFVRDDLSKWNS